MISKIKMKRSSENSPGKLSKFFSFSRIANVNYRFRNVLTPSNQCHWYSSHFLFAPNCLATSLIHPEKHWHRRLHGVIQWQRNLQATETSSLWQFSCPSFHGLQPEQKRRETSVRFYHLVSAPLYREEKDSLTIGNIPKAR